jgi:Flp pilus assembly protein TadG
MRRRLARFRDGEDGALSVEFAVLFPFLMLFYTAMFVFWDAFQSQSVAVRATETIADMMSRETAAFDADYLEGMHQVFDWLTAAGEGTAMRLSAVGTEIDAEGVTQFSVFWSHASATDVPSLTAEELEPRVPTPSLGEQLIVLETFVSHAPLFDVGLPGTRFHNLVVTRPRYVPQVLWAD